MDEGSTKFKPSGGNKILITYKRYSNVTFQVDKTICECLPLVYGVETVYTSFTVSVSEHDVVLVCGSDIQVLSVWYQAEQPRALMFNFWRKKRKKKLHCQIKSNLITWQNSKIILMKNF